jgi:hypothetical protein
MHVKRLAPLPLLLSPLPLHLPRRRRRRLAPPGTLLLSPLPLPLTWRLPPLPLGILLLPLMPWRNERAPASGQRHQLAGCSSGDVCGL